ncbi:hypothetical protein FXN61_25090 [Lentzea sp. PSKA42]|uniref:Uncharacterized protein n=1 Tax=Lentzea indica TaxID=2604800 RepID=A0ABX1FMT4_9PSEU|nr:hypothetical protein [Lentzea indica]NKE59902.1 hypothetical protein [Lentzea indica]
MSEFEAELRNKVTEAEQTLNEARQAGHDYEIHLHGARIRDLLDLAAQHDIDAGGWVDLGLLENSGLGH